MALTPIQRFFTDALVGAFDVGLATPDDVLRHVTPDVLAAHLPRPLWGKLIAACLAAPRTDARLVVDTISIPALCEHMPAPLLWSVLADVAQRALGKGLVAAPPPSAARVADKASDKGADKASDKASDKAADKASDKASDKAADKASDKAADKGSDKAADKTADKSNGKSDDKAATAAASTARASTQPPVSTLAPPRASTQPPVAAAPSRATTQPAVVVPPRDAAPPPAPPFSAGGTGTTESPVLSQVVDIDFDDDDDDEPLPLEAPPHSPHRAPTVPGPQVGRSNGGRGAGASSRRPQASTSPRSSSRTTPPSQRRAASSDFDIDTDVHAVKEPGAIEVPVDDDQLIDWSSSEETVTSGADLDRKR